jgi:membrane protein involved in colicin uptake
MQVGTLTDSMVRLRDEIVTLRQKRSLVQAELVRGAAERRAGVGALRMAFTRDRALAHRAWFGPTVMERRAELQKERRLAEEAKVHAQAEHERKIAEAKAHAQAEHERKAAEAKAHAQAEHERKTAEAKAHAQAEQKRKLAEEAKAVAQAEQDRKLAAEAKARMEAESKAALSAETAAAAAVPQAAQKHNSADRHPASRPQKVSQDKPSKKRHSSK